jgi:hypothetical protein
MYIIIETLRLIWWETKRAFCRFGHGRIAVMSLNIETRYTKHARMSETRTDSKGCT